MGDNYDDEQEPSSWQEPSWWFQTNARALAFIALVGGIGLVLSWLLR